MSSLERITDGLKLYEVLMLGFGSLMFLVTLALLIVFVVQKRPLKQLLFYFIIPVIMLGWSSLQKIKIDGKGIELDKTIAEYQVDSTTNKQHLEDLVNDIKSHDVKDPAVRKNIALAQFLLGKKDESIKTIESLPPEQKHDKTILDIQHSISISDALKNQIVTVQNNPTDSNALKKLNEINAQATSLEIKNTEVITNTKIADQKITEYQRINPRVDIRKTLVQPHH